MAGFKTIPVGVASASKGTDMQKMAYGCLVGLMAGMMVLLPRTGHARCLGPRSFQTCDDPATGAHFDVYHFGHETVLSGVKPDTGRTYQEFSTSLGRMTYTDGLDAAGRPQYEVRESFSRDFTDIYGTDARGKPYSSMETISPAEKTRAERDN